MNNPVEFVPPVAPPIQSVEEPLPWPNSAPTEDDIIDDAFFVREERYKRWQTIRQLRHKAYMTRVSTPLFVLGGTYSAVDMLQETHRASAGRMSAHIALCLLGVASGVVGAKREFSLIRELKSYISDYQ